MYMFYYDPICFNNLSREEFIEYLNAEGIPAFVCFPVLSKVEFYEKQDFRGKINHQNISNNYPVAQQVANKVVWLPHYTLLGDKTDIEEIVNAIRKIQRNVIKDQRNV